MWKSDSKIMMFNPWRLSIAIPMGKNEKIITVFVKWSTHLTLNFIVPPWERGAKNLHSRLCKLHNWPCDFLGTPRGATKKSESNSRFFLHRLYVEILLESNWPFKDVCSDYKQTSQILGGCIRTYPGLVKEPCVKIRSKNKIQNWVMGHYQIRSFSAPSYDYLYISIQKLVYKCRPWQGIMAD